MNLAAAPRAARQGRRVRNRWLAACIDSWQYTVIGLGALFVTAMVIRTAHALSETRESHAAIEAGLARAVADQHALDYATHVGCAPERELGGFRSRIETHGSGESRSLRIDVWSARGAGTLRRYECEVLTGSLPIALRRPFSVVGEIRGSLRAQREFMISHVAGAGARITAPTLDLSAVPPAESSIAGRSAFVRDDSLALHRLSGGTDQIDYRLQAGGDGLARLRFGAAGVLIVDGNLWLVGDERPLELFVERKATLVVRGNVYLERGVVLRGGGGLIVFVERTGGDDWIEGSGKLHLGLPPRSALADAGSRADGAIGCDLTFVVRDDVTVAKSFEVAGALVVGGDLTVADGAELFASGRRLPDFRAPHPAVRRVGEALPSRLRELPNAPGAGAPHPR